MSVIVSTIKFVVSYILPPVALLVAWQSRMDSKRAAAAAEKSAEEAKNNRKIAQRELTLPHIIEVKKFLGALDRAGEIKVGELEKIEASLAHLLHLNQFSFLKPITPIIENYSSSYGCSQPKDRVQLGHTQLDSKDGLQKIDFRKIVEELEKIKIGTLED